MERAATILDCDENHRRTGPHCCERPIAIEVAILFEAGRAGNPEASFLHICNRAQLPRSRCLCRQAVSCNLNAMCNRFRSIHEWSEIPRHLPVQTRLNFAFNPNVAPTELVPTFLATRQGPEPVIARFGINVTGKDGKPRPPLLNARTDGMKNGAA
jgi:hypothetical protein